MGAKILIVDDDPDAMRILRYALTAAGHRVIVAYGGEDAIRKAKAEAFDLVLTDLLMPKVSGVEVIRSIKSDPNTQHTPIVAVTAYVWDDIARAANQVGCDGYISKPFSSKQLVSDIQKYLPRHP